MQKSKRAISKRSPSVTRTREPRAERRNSPLNSASIALLSIGNELLDGRVINTNASRLGGLLHDAGIEVDETRAVPDTMEAIAEALHELAVHRHVVVTGGLGPTIDDITAVAASIAFGDPAIFHPKAERQIRATLGRLRFPFTKTQRRQAFLPSTAKVIPNRWGIAPGFSMRVHEAQFHFLPGVPRECLPMFEASVLPLVRKTQTRRKLLAILVWRAFGMREADLFDTIRPILRTAEKKFGANFVFSSQVPFPGCDVKLEFWSGRGKKTPSRAEIARIERAVDAKIGHVVYSRTRGESLAASVLALFRRHGLTLASAESCTGGMVGQLLTETAGASDVYMGGFVAYANHAKETFAGVRAATIRRHGAVSEAAARELAQGARDALHTDYAVSLTGIAGPGGGSAQKPVGTIYVGLADAVGTDFEHRVILGSRGDRLQNRLYASHLALAMLRNTVVQKFEGQRNGTRSKHRQRK